MCSPRWAIAGFMGALLLAPTGSAAGPESPAGAKAGESRPVLELASPDPGECPLGLSWRWGSMAVKRVHFEDHEGPFKAVVDSTGQGVRITFHGWGKDPFVASADRQVRVVYR